MDGRMDGIITLLVLSLLCSGESVIRCYEWSNYIWISGTDFRMINERTFVVVGVGDS